ELLGIDLAAHARQLQERLHLGREHERAVRQARIDERLLPYVVPRQHQPLARRVPERDREHPGQPPGEAEPVLLVQMRDDRRVSARCGSRFSPLQGKRRGGFRIAALMRPPDAGAGEDEQRWLERAHAAAERGPLGLHTHFVSPDRARPAAPGPEHGARVRREAEWMETWGLAPTLFCAGGWYMDGPLAATVADLGLVDCSATAFRPGYLA